MSMPFARSITHPALERALELPDLVVQHRGLAVAAERHLDRRLHVLGVVRRDVGRDSGQVEVALAPCPGIRMRAIIG
jgi:hypothetical protein